MPRSICVLALLLPLTAFAGDKREAVLDLLNAFEDSPSAADLQALGDGVDAELMEIADDTTVPHTRRGRAVSALQHFPSAPVRTFLEGQLAGTDALNRRKAAYSLVVFGADVVPLLDGALQDDDVQLRIAAAIALGSIDGDAAKAALEGALKKEKESAVQDAIQKSIGEAK